MIDLARSKDKKFDPMVWMVHTSKNTVFNNALPLHREIYDIANMLVYKNICISGIPLLQDPLRRCRKERNSKV